MSWKSHNFKIRKGTEMKESEQKWTQKSSGPGEKERGHKEIGPYGDSLNAIMWGRDKDKFPAWEKNLGWSSTIVKRSWAKLLRATKAHGEHVPREAGAHKRSLMTWTEQHTGPPGKASKLPDLALDQKPWSAEHRPLPNSHTEWKGEAQENRQSRLRSSTEV